MVDRTSTFYRLASDRYHAFALAHSDERLFKLLLAGLIGVWFICFGFLICSGQVRTVESAATAPKALVTCELPQPYAPGLLLRCTEVVTAASEAPSI